MGMFKPMVKMETTEPSVELKLKKGGSATRERFEKMAKKADGGAVGMMAGMPPPTTPMGNPAAARAMAARRMMKGAPPMGPTAQTGRPPMAMPAGSMARPPMMKEGGKVDMAQDKAMIKKAFKQHDMQEHKGASGTKLKLKNGGATMDSAMTKTTIKGNAGAYSKTKMHDGDKTDRAHGTGKVKEGNAGGFKKGGMAMCYGGKMATGGSIPSETIRGKPSKTIVDEGKADRAHGTGGVKMGNAAGFKTGGVMEANGGGYKRGGTPVKKLARGGSVQDDGAAEKMPQGRKAPSAPVAISKLSGTFKRGGEVC